MPCYSSTGADGTVYAAAPRPVLATAYLLPTPALAARAFVCAPDCLPPPAPRASQAPHLPRSPTHGPRSTPSPLSALRVQVSFGCTCPISHAIGVLSFSFFFPAFPSLPASAFVLSRLLLPALQGLMQGGGGGGGGGRGAQPLLLPDCPTAQPLLLCRKLLRARA